MKRLLLLMSLCALLQACGQKGPLYLPQSDHPGAEQPPQSTGDNSDDE